MGVTKYILKHPVTTVMALLCLVVFGISSVFSAKFFPCHLSTSILCTISMIVSSFPIRVNHPLLYRTEFSVQKIPTCEPLQAGCSLTAKMP